MHDDITAVEKLDQLKIAATKMVDPDRRVSQHPHQKRRRGGAFAPGSLPPKRASRRAASRSMNAFKASRMTADFSVTPAYSCALANNSSSIAIVVLIP